MLGIYGAARAEGIQGVFMKLKHRYTPKQMLITAVACVLIGVTCYLLDKNTDLDRMALTLIAIVMVIIVFFAVPLAAQLFTTREQVSDARDTCDPIIKRYCDTGNLDQFLREYRAWKKDVHDPNLRLQFGERVIEYLVDAREFEEARRELKELGTVPTTDSMVREYQSFYDKYNRTISTGRSHNAQAKKKRK